MVKMNYILIVIALLIVVIVHIILTKRKNASIKDDNPSRLTHASHSSELKINQNSPVNWKQLIETIRSSLQTNNNMVILELKDKYIAQMTFWGIFNQRYDDDKVFYPLPFEYNDATIKVAQDYQRGIKIIKTPLLEHLKNYTPEYQITSNGQIGRVVYGIGAFDLLLIGASSFLKGRPVSLNNQAQLAVEAVSHYAKIPIVSYFFALPLLNGSFSPSPNEINQMEIAILTGIENLLMEIYDELEIGGVITDELVVEKVKSFFDKSARTGTNNNSSVTVEKQNSDATGHYARGDSMYLQGNFNEAIVEYDKAVVVDANLTGAYFKRGLSFAKTGDYDRAISDFNKVLEIDPNHPHAKETIALARKRQGIK
jgi:tetratricopeptide (TPR) repeat protein